MKKKIIKSLEFKLQNFIKYILKIKILIIIKILLQKKFCGYFFDLNFVKFLLEYFILNFFSILD